MHDTFFRMCIVKMIISVVVRSDNCCEVLTCVTDSRREIISKHGTTLLKLREGWGTYMCSPICNGSGKSLTHAGSNPTSTITNGDWYKNSALSTTRLASHMKRFLDFKVLFTTKSTNSLLTVCESRLFLYPRLEIYHRRNIFRGISAV